MIPKRFYFLTSDYSLHKSSDRKTWELERARALSHAAKKVNRKRKSKEEEERQQEDATVSGPYRDVQGLPKGLTEGLLDPFVSLSMDLTVEDRDLLHSCETLSPPEFPDLLTDALFLRSGFGAWRFLWHK